MLRFLAASLLITTPAMLAIHLASYKLVQQWCAPNSSWAARWLPPMRLLRLEAGHWVLALAAWPLWRSVAAKMLVMVFASLHLIGWIGAEFRGARLHQTFAKEPYRPVVALGVAAFDLVEFFALLVVGWSVLNWLVSA